MSSSAPAANADARNRGVGTAVSQNRVAAMLTTAVALLPGREIQTCLVLGLSASCSLLLPVSTPPNAVAHATGEIQSKDFWPSGVLIGLLGPMAVIAWVLLMGSIIE